MPKTRVFAPPDQAQRKLILTELDKTILVEAAAGTGKTSSMIGRMVSLLAKGKCRIENLAAVTFTRQAASEMQARFQIELERAVRESQGLPRDRLKEALRQSQRAFIGTIHSFCARLLRERPVEAGIGGDFRELDKAEDLRLKKQAWQEHLTRCHALEDPLLTELEALGMNFSQLEGAFLRLADYPDVNHWPVAKPDLPDLKSLAKRLLDYAARMDELAPLFPENFGKDRLIPKYNKVSRMVRHADLGRPAEVMEVLEEFDDLAERQVISAFWPGKEVTSRQEYLRWQDFGEAVAKPALKIWRQRRYAQAMRTLKPAIALYDQLRQANGALNFQDLLLAAAGLLRDKPEIRSYFRRRFSHILVDEFQDTDPIQAEVILLLTADEPKETNWRACRPVPGSLFVVGDPKQSIYRFRRADIVTYNQVKEIIEKSGGLVVVLSANFRTTTPVREWINQTFGARFPQKASKYSPAHVELQAGRQEEASPELAGVRVLDLPNLGRASQPHLAYETGLIARTIRQAVDQGLPLLRTAKEVKAGLGPEARPADFMIITRVRKNLRRYAQALCSLGLDCQVVGGTWLNEVEELRLLMTCLAAVVEPENPLALVAVLRGELFGFSDEELYRYKKLGGRFSCLDQPPAGLEPEIAARLAQAFSWLRLYAAWLDRLPALAAVEKMAGHLGLVARAAARPGGLLLAGSLGKAFELLRAWQSASWSAADLIGQLEAVVNQETHYDGLPAKWPREPGVRVMNLHQAKGLEAAVVFLADPTGNQKKRPVEIHIDRSGDEAKGYLPIYQPYGRYHQRLWAEPPEWVEKSEEEERFAQAEEDRLLYVAVSRAGQRLCVSQRASYQNENPWAPLEPYLEDSLRLKEPEPAKTPSRLAPTIPAKEAAKAEAAVGRRLEEARRPTYAIEAAKAFALGPEPPQQPALSAGEHGTEWGQVIHSLLEAALTNPQTDLRPLAAAQLAEYQLDPKSVGQALKTVQAVMGSQIWRRAQESPRRLAEAPFQALISGPPGRLTILRGVIDLVFEEDSGWVIVDYKTDDRAGKDLAPFIEHYRPQVETYARLWEEMTGQKVKEAGLYFVHSDEYIVCWRG